MRRQKMSVENPSAALPLVETKLVPARPAPELVVRARLLDDLDRMAASALTLVDAPIGFGKTTLVASWGARTESAVAWVSLDEADDDPVRLWTYVATSVDRIRSGLGRPALARLRGASATAEPAVDELVNALSSFGAPVAIVLDDLHSISSEACLRGLTYALERLPDNARFIVTTRSDPELPLGRLRASGMLGEIRAADLAFTIEEARALLVDAEGIRLDDGEVELLVDRTEGWPAGLYLAALWLRRLEDPRAGVYAFQGDHRHVADYLTSEVLDALDEDTRGFMLRTSVLGTFNASLCDAALERSDSAQRLHDLERSNGFLIGLDARGDWYRYHQLFGELLQLELASVEPGAAARLHRRASEWCHENGLLEAALDHAAAAGDTDRVAAILVDEHRTLLLSGRLLTVVRWCASLGDDVLVRHPTLPLAAVFAAGLGGSSSHARHRFLAIAERSREEQPSEWGAYHQAGLAHARSIWVEEELGRAVELARRAADFARDIVELTVPTLANLAFLLFLAGDRVEANRRVRDALARPEATARPHGYVLALATRSLLESDAGLDERAEASAREAIDAATSAGVESTWSGGAARVALGSALARRGRLREAEREAQEGARLRRQTIPDASYLHALVVLASIRARRGRVDRALRDLGEVRRALEGFGDAGRLPALADGVETALAEVRAAGDAHAEPPSAAEQSVLRLMATDLTQREIGQTLFLSVNTVKTHTRSLYRKLGVTSRDEAVRRAAALGLLDAGDSPG